MPINLLYDPEFLIRFRFKWVFLDTDVIIDSFKNLNLRKLLLELKNQDVELMTIPSVFFEFMRGADSIPSFTANVEYVKNLLSIYPFEKNINLLEELSDFTIVMSRIKNNKSYADYLLAACLYKFSDKAFLITANNKDYPLDILERESLIACDDGKNIKNYGIYSFSNEKYGQVAKNILKSK